MVLIIPNVYLVSIKGTSGGQNVINVVGVLAGFSSAAAVAAAVNTAWKVTGGPLSKLPSTYSFQEVKAMELTTATGQIAVLPTSGTGAVVGALATNGSCALVTYGSGTRSKSQRGRMYVGPLREGDIDADGRTLSAPAAWATAFTAFRTSIQGSGMEWGVISRKLSTFTGITTVGCQNIIATQRRRIR